MQKQKEPARGRAASSRNAAEHRARSEANRLREKVEFVVDRAPDRLIGLQPYWHLGAHRQTNILNIPIEFDFYVSLCAACGAPFLVSTVGPINERHYVNRRCPDHRRPGSRVGMYRPTWRIARDGGR